MDDWFLCKDELDADEEFADERGFDLLLVEYLELNERRLLILDDCVTCRL